MTSTVAVVILGVLGVIVGALLPGLLGLALFDPGAVLDGQIWRAVTWPWLDRISLWTVLSLAMLWYFGSDLERQVGRSRMALLYLGSWGILTLVALGVGTLLGGGLMLGLGFVQVLVLLLWIAEYPRRPFFFGIPAWVIGLVLVALQVLTLIASRQLGGIVSLTLSFVLVAMLARRVGLLGDYAWIPGRRQPRPASAVRVPTKTQRRQDADAGRIDQLLDKINAQGLHSLSDAERREMQKLRQRRQR